MSGASCAVNGGIIDVVRGRPDQIERAQSEMASAISVELTAQGWVQRDVDDRALAVFTFATGNGVMATAELVRTSFQWPEDWPIEVAVRIGVGYEPALDLMPLLTLRPDVALLASDEQQHAPRFTVTLDGAGDVASTSARIVAVITERAGTFARQFTDAAAIEAALTAQQRTEPPQPSPGGDPGDVERYRHYINDLVQRRLVLLAATGQHDEARTLLSSYPSQRDESFDRADRRFLRQLTRWLDAGGPAAPPLAQTLAELPRTPKPPRPSWSTARERSKRLDAARDAVKDRLDGHTTDDIVAMLAAEYADRDVDVSPSDVAFAAEMMQTEHRVRQQRFGRTRLALTVLHLLRETVGDAIRAYKNRADEPPQWLRPPARATYPMARTSRHTAVSLDPDARSWLDRAWTESPRRIGPNASVKIWLTSDSESTELIAHLGDRRVGTIAAGDTGAFTRTMHAATLFDEDPVTRGILAKLPESGTLILEIPTPQ